MAHLSLSQSFLVFVSIQPASPLSPLFSPPHQHLASLQPTIILALTGTEGVVVVGPCHRGGWPPSASGSGICVVGAEDGSGADNSSMRTGGGVRRW